MINWYKYDGGEYNEHHANYGNRVLIIYSDKDGEEWSYYFDDAGLESYPLEAKSLEEAMNEVEKLEA